PLATIDQVQVRELETKVEQLLHAPLVSGALLSAAYQKWNAALSLAVIRHLCPQIDERCVLEKFAAARLLGRLWQVEERVYADIAHNAEKIAALTSEIEMR